MTAKDVPATAAVLATSLESNPAYAVVFPDPSARAAPLAEFFAGSLRVHLSAADVYVPSWRT